MKCVVCDTRHSNYKCPNCRISYCSVDCWKEHKKTECHPVTKTEDINKEDGTEKTSVMYKTEDTVPPEKLKLLETSKTLQQILQNPHLQDLLTSVDTSTNPERAMQLVMQEPLFVEFADECLRIVEPVGDTPS